MFVGKPAQLGDALTGAAPAARRQRCFIRYPADIPFITEIFIGVNTESLCLCKDLTFAIRRG
jgi:hypothetical protein